MRNRVSKSSNPKVRGIALSAAAMTLILSVLAAAFLFHGSRGYLVLENFKTGEIYQRFPMKIGDTFSIGFIHSVNKSPVTDFYEIRKDGIYVVKTVYYGFGAGVQTELGEGQTLTYGEDGSMIITGFEQKMDNLVYFVGTVSDHTLTLYERNRNTPSDVPPPSGISAEKKQEISLRSLCGKSAMVRFSFTES